MLADSGLFETTDIDIDGLLRMLIRLLINDQKTREKELQDRSREAIEKLVLSARPDSTLHPETVTLADHLHIYRYPLKLHFRSDYAGPMGVVQPFQSQN